MIEVGGVLYVTRAEASDQLTSALGRGWSIRQVDRHIDKGNLGSVKFDDLQWVYIPEADVKKLIVSRPRNVENTATRKRKSRARATA